VLCSIIQCCPACQLVVLLCLSFVVFDYDCNDKALYWIMATLVLSHFCPKCIPEFRFAISIIVKDMVLNLG